MIQTGRDAGEAYGQLRQKITRPDVLAGENNQAYRNQQEARQDRDDEACDSQQGESPAYRKNEPSFARPVQLPLPTLKYRHTCSTLY